MVKRRIDGRFEQLGRMYDITQKKARYRHKHRAYIGVLRCYKWGLDSVRGFYTTYKLFIPNAMRPNPETKSCLRALSYSPSLRVGALCLENERSTNLVVGLVELLGIEGGTNAESNTRSEENVVGNGSNTTVVDLGL